MLKFTIKNKEYNIENIHIKTSISEDMEITIYSHINYKNSNDVINEETLFNTIEIEIDKEDKKINITAYIVELTYLEDSLTLCKIVCRSKFTLLSLITYTRLFSEKNISEILKSIMDEVNLKCTTDININKKLSIIQYNESNLDFVNRICYLNNIYYIYDVKNEKIIFSNKGYRLEKINDKITYAKKIPYFKITSKNVEYMFKEQNKTSCITELTNTKSKNSKYKQQYYIYNNNFDKECIKNISQGKSYSIDSTSINYIINDTCFSGETYEDRIIVESHTSMNKKDLILQSKILTKNKNFYKLPEAKINNGLIINGIVEEDADAQNVTDDMMIKVRPIFCKSKKETIMVRMTSSFTGNNYGSFIIPRGQQEIYIYFVDEMLSSAVFLGCAYNSNNKTNIPIKDGIGIYVPKTKKSGSKDKDKPNSGVHITDKEIKINSEEDMKVYIGKKSEYIVKGEYSGTFEEKYTLESKKSISFKTDEELNQEASKDITIVSKNGDITIKGANIKIESTKDISVKCNNFKIDAKQIISSKCLDYKIDAKKEFLVKSNINKIDTKILNMKSMVFKNESKLMSIKSTLFNMSCNACIILKSNAGIVLNTTAVLTIVATLVVIS